jgi:hypothetical protein
LLLRKKITGHWAKWAGVATELR